MSHIKCEFAQVGMACARCGEDGFVEGTTVRMESDWRNVAWLVEGDMVFTFENGLQPVRQITVIDIWKQPGTCPSSVCPLFVPSGALGNEEDLVLQGETMVALASKAFEKQNGSRFALLQGADLIGFIGIELFQPDVPAKLYQLHFDQEELVPVANGAIACCPSILSALSLDASGDRESIEATTTGIPKLDHMQAKAFLAHLEQELVETLNARAETKSAS
ncbi:Hint domain-containing protein [Shimia gijangensis]|nr:Hint domain-containing protein [Shimia gijangensis]